MATESFIKNALNRFKVADEKIAFYIYDGNALTHITYKEFLSDILAYTGYFVRNGIKGQHIALVAPNSYAWIAVFYAILASGNIAVPMNPNLADELLLKEITQADISLICGDISVAEKPAVNIPLVKLDKFACSTPVLLEEAICVDDNETIMLIFTSGTTGKNKIAEFTSNNIMETLDGYRLTQVFSEKERSLLLFPMHHIGGLMLVLNDLNHGISICLGRGPAYMFNDMHAMNPTQAQVVPSMLESVMKVMRNSNRQDFSKYLGDCLRKFVVGAAMVRPDEIGFFVERGYIMEARYSMTELCGLSLTCEIDASCPNKIGKPVGNMECCIKNGEILLKSKSVMKGYYKDPGETARVIWDDWLHTGDLGYCDEQGDYYITGRKKNTIILSNGENVNPEEIEAVWSRCSAIQECLIYADDKGICADVYVSNREQAAQFIRDYNGSVPRYHQVYKVLYSETPLEKTASGKLKRKGNNA